MQKHPDGVIAETDFLTIRPIWESSLWPGRESKIESGSAIDMRGEIDLDWLQATPRFWRLVVANEIAGVVSGLFFEPQGVRLRGLWVNAKFRGRGLGKRLVQQVKQTAEQQQADCLWTMARASAASFYRDSGFVVGHAVHGYEFGPHQIMHLLLKK